MPALPNAHPSTREQAWAGLASTGGGEGFDVLVIGGGATGLGVALDAAARGLRVALVEAVDFAKGTSSRSTKLVHGGVRYLAQGRIGLVREALRERASLLANAPHLASALPFVMPARGLADRLFYGIGLRLYGALAGSRSLGPTEDLSADEAAAAVPGLKPAVHKGGVRYWDAQFDDARVAVALARTAASKGAVVLNHAEVLRLLHEGAPGANVPARVVGAEVQDRETGLTIPVRARCVVNATGVWVDRIRGLDASGLDSPSAPRQMVTPSQGVHLVVDASFLGGDHALVVPRTSDGRVVFAVPWLGHVVLGTTDTPRSDLPLEPVALPEEVGFILREAGRHLRRAPSVADVKSMWVGLRPLVCEDSSPAVGTTGSISREHAVQVSPSGLLTVTGGKWTTYRAMAEDVLERAQQAGLLPLQGQVQATQTPRSVTAHLPLLGTAVTRPCLPLRPLSDPPGVHLYGQEANLLAEMPGHHRWLWQHGPGGSGQGLSESMVRFAARHEMARTVEDVLARRSRLLFLDAAKAAEVAPQVEEVLAEELGRAPDSDAVQAFRALAVQYSRVALQVALQVAP